MSRTTGHERPTTTSASGVPRQFNTLPASPCSNYLARTVLVVVVTACTITPQVVAQPAAPAVAVDSMTSSLGCARDRLVVIGHRGTGPGTRRIGGALYSEDTIGAFRAAMREGVDGFETDYWPTADNYVVSHHDPTLTRMTNGSGEIRKSSLRYIGTLRNVSGARVPTMGSVEAAMRPYRGHRQQEFKNGRLFSDRVLTRLLRIDRRYVGDIRSKTLITSSQKDTLWRIRTIDPAFPLGLIHRSITQRPVLAHVPKWVDVVLIDFDAAGAVYIQRAEARGLQVSLRDVNTVRRLHRAAAMGASRIVTDRPEVLGKAC